MSTEVKETIDKKLFCYTIQSSEDLELIFKKVKEKINDKYDDLESRGLIYTHIMDGYKYFLDVREMNYYDKVSEDGKLSIFNCILYKLREDDFPYLFNLTTGKKTEIPSDAKDTLMEQTHFIVIPEINIIISEYNHIGANVASRLLFVIDKVLGSKYSTGFKVEHILDSKTSYRIRNMKKVRKLQFKAGHQGMKTISKYFRIGALDAMNNTFDNLNDLEFEIIIKGKGRGKKSKDINIESLENFKKLCEEINNCKDKKKLDIQKAKIIDPTYNTSLPLDLFEEYLVTHITAVKLSKRIKYIDSDDMFKKMIDVYNSNKFELSNYKDIVVN